MTSWRYQVCFWAGHFSKNCQSLNLVIAKRGRSICQKVLLQRLLKACRGHYLTDLKTSCPSSIWRCHLWFLQAARLKKYDDCSQFANFHQYYSLFSVAQSQLRSQGTQLTKSLKENHCLKTNGQRCLFSSFCKSDPVSYDLVYEAFYRFRVTRSDFSWYAP